MIYSRRDWLSQAANGFGSVALFALLAEQVRSEARASGRGATPLAYPQRAKSIIFLYMDGGPSQVDTFDPKPMLVKHDGEDPGKFFKVSPTQFNNNGTVLKSPWTFRKHGQSGIEVSALFPFVAEHVDSLAVIRSMTSKFPEHTFANYFLHTGSGLQGRPSMGAWATYGLGSECQELPGFVVLNGGLIPPGGLDCFGNGFLPASYQGSVLRPTGHALANAIPIEASSALQEDKLSLLRKLDQSTLAREGRHDELESAIKNYETAFRMQAAIP